MPRKHGDVRVDESYSYYEKFWHYEIATTVPNNTTTNIGNIGTFTMPWAGTAFMDLTCFAIWNGYQHIAPYLYATPAMSYVPSFNVMEDAIGNTWRIIHLFGGWSSLASGQLVTVGVSLRVFGGGPSVDFHRAGGSVRAYPT